MSRTIDPSELHAQRRPRGRLTNWRRWAEDGQMHELRRGEDFPANDVSASSKRSTFRQWAARQPGVTKDFMEHKVHTWVPDNDTLVIHVEGGLPRVAEPGSPMAQRRAAESRAASSDQPSDEAPSDGASSDPGVAVRRRR